MADCQSAAACQAAPHSGKPQTEHRAEFYGADGLRGGITRRRGGRMPPRMGAAQRAPRLEGYATVLRRSAPQESSRGAKKRMDSSTYSLHARPVGRVYPLRADKRSAMRTLAIGSLTTALLASLAFGQTPAAPGVDRVFYFTHTDNPQNLQEILNIVRAMNDSTATLDRSKKTLSVHGTSAQIALVEWLLPEMDKPAGTP